MKWLESARDVRKLAVPGCVTVSPDQKLCTYTIVYDGRPGQYQRGDQSDEEDEDEYGQCTHSDDTNLVSLPLEKVFPDATLVSLLVDSPTFDKVRVRITTVTDDTASPYSVGYAGGYVTDQEIGLGGTLSLRLNTTGSIVHVLTFGSAKNEPFITVYDRQEVEDSALAVVSIVSNFLRWCTRLMVLTVLVALLAIYLFATANTFDHVHTFGQRWSATWSALFSYTAATAESGKTNNHDPDVFVFPNFE